MSKQLSIIVQAKDQATGVLRTVGTGVLQVGNEADKSDKKTKGWLSSLTKGLSAAKLALGGLVAGFAVHRLVSSFRSATNELDKLGKAARQYGLTVQEISGLAYAGDLANVELDSLLSGLGTFSKGLGQFALTGGGKAAEAIKLLEQWGVSVKDANDQLRPMSALLPDIADAFERMGPASREFFAAKLGLGGDVGRLLSEGGERLRFYFDEAERLGAIFTPEQTDAAEEFNDAITRVGKAWLGLKARIVEEVAPSITEALKGFAGFIAAMPKVVGNFSRNLRAAIDGNEFASGMFRELGAQALTTTGVVFREVGILAATAFYQSFIATITATFEQAAALASVNAKFFKRWVQSFFTEDTEMVKRAMLDIASIATDPNTKTLTERLRDGIDLTGQWNESWARVAATVKDLGSSLNNVLGATEALSKSSVVGLTPPDRPRGPLASIEDNGLIQPTSFGKGVREGFKDLINQARDLEAQGRQMVLGISSALTTNLSSAIGDVIGGVQNLKEAFRNFLSSTLSQVSQLIIQMLLLRAIGGIAGAFVGGGAVTGPGTAGIGAPGVMNPTGVVVNSGGFITRGGVRRFAGGVVALGAAGIVPGPSVSRDIIPALLTPGESVITRRGTGANDMATLAYMNRGGRVEPAGASGKGGLVVNMTINLSGTATESDAQRVARAVRSQLTDVLFDDLRRSPAKRDELRRITA